MDALFQRNFESPIGTVRCVANQNALVGVYLPAQAPVLSGVRFVERHDVLDQVIGELGSYFAGETTQFQTPIDITGTEFQRTVWTALVEIPFGETRSYSELAARIGRPTASRAVGAANGRNPISIVIPCHRVIASSGALTGYAGGLEAKKYLLRHES